MPQKMMIQFHHLNYTILHELRLIQKCIMVPRLISILVIFDLNSNKMIYTIHQGLICPQYPQKAFISNPNMDI